LVLGALADGPLHGYGIVKTIREGSEETISLPESQLYPLLHRMQAAGWIAGEWQTPDSGPARKTYTLTESGESELARRRKEWTRFAGAVGSLLAVKELRHG
jgi:DNA-binding PadR family transcriptional regulator